MNSTSETLMARHKEFPHVANNAFRFLIDQIRTLKKSTETNESASKKDRSKFS